MTVSVLLLRYTANYSYAGSGLKEGSFSEGRQKNHNEIVCGGVFFFFLFVLFVLFCLNPPADG